MSENVPADSEATTRFLPRDWIFRGFVTGICLGWVVGAIVVEVWGRYWYKGNSQTPLAFFALLGGGVGLGAGIVHRWINR